jgi:hypothetical protein
MNGQTAMTNVISTFHNSRQGASKPINLKPNGERYLDMVSHLRLKVMTTHKAYFTLNTTRWHVSVHTSRRQRVSLPKVTKTQCNLSQQAHYLPIPNLYEYRTSRAVVRPFIGCRRNNKNKRRYLTFCFSNLPSCKLTEPSFFFPASTT